MSFFRQFLIYGVSGAASRLAAVVLVPLYTRTLSITDYGQLELLLALHALIVILAGMQVESAVARDFFDAKAAGRRHVLAWTAVMLTLAGTALVALVALAAWGLGWLSATLSLRDLGLLLALTIPAQLFGIQLVMLRFEGHALFFASMSFCDLASCALFSVLFIVGLKLGVQGALWGVLCGKVLCMALAWSRSFGPPRGLQVDRTMSRQMLHYGVPALPAVLLGWLQNAGSRLMLAIALTLSDVAIASIAIKVAAIYGFVVYSFRLAWEPFSMAKLASVDNDPHVYNRALEWYVATMFLVAGGAVLLGPYVVRVLAPPAYADGGWIAAFFLLGQFWVGVTNVLVIGIHGARRTSWLLPVYGWGVLINVTVLFAFAPWLGVAASGFGFLLGSVGSACVALHYSNRHFKAGFSTGILGWTALATAVLALVWYQLATGLAPGWEFSRTAAPVLAGAAGLVVLLVALVARMGFQPGRSSAMLKDAAALLRARAGTP